MRDDERRWKELDAPEMSAELQGSWQFKARYSEYTVKDLAILDLRHENLDMPRLLSRKNCLVQIDGTRFRCHPKFIDVAISYNIL